MDKVITTSKTEEIKGSAFGKLKAGATKNKNTSLELQWTKISGVDGYMIYSS